MRLFANRSLTIGTTVMVTNFFALFSTIFFMTLYLQNVQGFSPMATGVRTLPLSLMLMVTAPVSGIVTRSSDHARPWLPDWPPVSAGPVLADLPSYRLRLSGAVAGVHAAGAGIGLVLTAGE